MRDPLVWRRTVALSVGLTAATASACRPALSPPAVAYERSVPTSEATVATCWVESRARFGFTASSLLIRHAEGDLLIDAGNSSNFDAEIEVYEGSTKRWLATMPAALKPRLALDDLLRTLEVAPEGLRAVIPTHAHLDHIGGALDLPPVELWVDAAEAALIERSRDELRFEVIPAHAEGLHDRLVPLEWRDEPYEIFAQHVDVFEDGSVVLVPLRGHTPGSLGVFVRLPDGRRIFHVGDPVNDRVQLARLRGRTPLMRRTDSDPETAAVVVGQLAALAEAVPELYILPAHERAAWREVFGAPADTCPR